MGKKIPGKKHHGVKDPEKQAKVRLDKIKNKINSNPGKSDFQEIPRSMQLIMKAKEDLKNQKVEEKRPKKEKIPEDEKGLLDSTKYMNVEPRLHGMNRPLKPVPVFKQQLGENKRAFFYRMDKSIQSMKARKEWENRYGVEVTTDDHGNQKVIDQPKDEVTLEIEEKKKKKLAKKGIVVRSKEEKRVLRREREKKRKNKNKKNTKDKDYKEFSDFQDNVEFGETVHAPPTITGKYGNDKKTTGQKELLLNKSFEGKKDNSFEGKKDKLVGVKKVKVKQSLAKKVIMEKERQRVVDLYRAMKAQKMQETT